MLGTLLGGRYKVINILSAGGFAQTYVAEDTQRPGHPKCVVKHLKPRRQDPKFLQMARRLFKTEAETLEKLGCHDQIPHLLAYFEEKEEFYLVQQFISGPPLSDELQGGRQLTEAQVINLLQDVLSTLEFVHSYQVIHRDIKPANLIRRHQDGKLALIDFGAVKEISTQLESALDQTGMTVGIGTQGYTPSEQIVGKPRFSSDLYALGITAIQSLTGLKPHQLAENPETSEISWRQQAKVSNGLATILDKMVRYHFRDRYQSATEVLQAIQQLTQATADPTLPSSNPPARTRQSFTGKAVLKAIASLALTGLVLGVRQLGLLEPLELGAFDQMLRLRYATRVLGDLDRNQPLEGQDPRLLVVAVTEADIKAQKQWPPSDRTVNKLLAQLERHQPRAIGLDIYRDLPIKPGQAELAARMKKSGRIISVCKVGDAKNPGIPPPRGVLVDRVGFSDIAVDPGGVVRRALLFINPPVTSRCSIPYSFSFQLARRYLEKEGIKPKVTSEDYLQLGSTVFKPLKPNFGGYQTADAGGYQIVLDYRSAHNIAQQVTFTQVLNGQFDPNWVKDKLVLIGVTAPSLMDTFYTPYSEGRPMTGALLHAQMVSQILSVVLDKRPLLWFMSEEVVVLWIAGWGLVSSLLTWKIRHPLLLILSAPMMLGVLLGTGFWLFTQEGWVPVVAPALCLVVTSASIVTSRLYRAHRHSRVLTEETPTAPAASRPLVEPALREDTLPIEILSFESGSTEIMVHGSLEPNQRQSYWLNCSQGQLLTLQVTEGNINLTVLAPDRQSIGRMSGSTKKWQGLVHTPGNYIIEVSTAVASPYTVSFNLANQNFTISGTATSVLPSKITQNLASTETMTNPDNFT